MPEATSFRDHRENADRAIALALGLAEQELPSAASIAQLALHTTDPQELERLLRQLYEQASNDDCPYLAELADEALHQLDLASAS